MDEIKPFFVGLPGTDRVFIAYPGIGNKGKIVYWININGTEVLFVGNQPGGPMFIPSRVYPDTDTELVKEIATALENIVKGP